MRRVWPLLFFVGLGVVAPSAVEAQNAPAARPWLIEGVIGHAEFADSPPVPHSVVGAGARVYVTPRLAIGPELAVMNGPGRHRDTFLTGNITWDFRAPSTTRRVGVVPYLIAGGGITSITDEVGTGLYSSTEGAFTAGAGLRIESPLGLYVAPEVRVGWELHWRAGVMIGWRK